MALLVIAGVAATVAVQSNNIYIQNTEPTEIKFKARTTGQSAPWIEFVDGNTMVFQLPATGILPAAYGGTGSAAAFVQSGSMNNTNAFMLTNTFATAFSVAPTVVVTSATNALPHIVSITTSNFVAGAALTNSTIYWVAVGAP